MVGKIMSAKKAKEEYGFSSIVQTGGSISLLNTSGKRVEVDPKDPVYHRGNETFGIYSSTRDAHRISTGRDPLHIGKGEYRQTNDRKKKR